MKKQEYKILLYLGDKQVETLPQEVREKISQRLSKQMSIYCTAHPQSIPKEK